MIEVLYSTGEVEHFPEGTEFETFGGQFANNKPTVLVIREVSGDLDFKPLDAVKEIRAA